MQLPEFPLEGVIGIVANSANEIHLAKTHGLQCIEMRPDLLLDRGHSLTDVMAMVREISGAGLKCLFTLRRHDHGGKFNGSDREQMQLCLQAVAAGADIVDVEWDSKCASELIAHGALTILSNHDFNGMPSASGLAAVTQRITAHNPAAIKMVTTATCFEDAVRMLQWVSDIGEGPRRIGFAMGALGEFSRILTRCFGGPITYATFDAPVAPGQIPAQQLLSRYHASTINAQTRVIGVAGDEREMTFWLDALNQSDLAMENQLVAVPIPLDDFSVVHTNAAFLRMDYAVAAASQSDHLPISMRVDGQQACIIDFNQGNATTLGLSMDAALNDCIAMLNRRYA